MKKLIAWLKMLKKTLKQIKRREEVDLRNEADSLVFQVEKTITDLGDNISEDDKKNAEEKNALKSARR